jgi:hypothetical protein
MGRRADSLSLANACNPYCKRIPLAQDNTSRVPPPLVFHLAPTHLGWDTQRQLYSSVQGPPRGRNADNSVYIFMPTSIGVYDIYFSQWPSFHLLSVYDSHFTQTFIDLYALSRYLTQCVYGVSNIYVNSVFTIKTERFLRSNMKMRPNSDSHANF